VFIAELIEKAPKMNSVESTLVLRDFYETHYGIYNHLSGSTARPLASVAMHDAEENGRHSSAYEIIKVIAESEVLKHFGMSLIEFLSMPREYVTYMLEVSSAITNKNSNSVSDQLDALKGIGNKK